MNFSANWPILVVILEKVVALARSHLAGSRRAIDALRANKDALLAVLRRYGVTNPRLFGSVARGEDTAKSDIDLLVSRTAPMSYTKIAKLRKEVSAAVGWPVDLVFDTSLKGDVEEDLRHDLQPMP